MNNTFVANLLHQSDQKCRNFTPPLAKCSCAWITNSQRTKAYCYAQLVITNSNTTWTKRWEIPVVKNSSRVIWLQHGEVLQAAAYSIALNLTPDRCDQLWAQGSRLKCTRRYRWFARSKNSRTITHHVWQHEPLDTTRTERQRTISHLEHPRRDVKPIMSAVH